MLLFKDTVPRNRVISRNSCLIELKALFASLFFEMMVDRFL